MKNMTKEEIFEAALILDEELDMAIGTDEEEEVKEEAAEIMNYIEVQGWREEFDQYVQDM